MGFFSDLFGTSGAATDAASAKIRGYQLADQAAVPLYEQGRTAINTGYGQAQNLFAPIVGQAQQGASAYGDLAGAAGTEGQDRARALFRTDPGYQFARDEALRATERTTGTGGNQGSGGVLAALEQRASDLASQQYGAYANRLAPYLGYSLGATQGGAGAYAGQAGALNASDIAQGNLLYGSQVGEGGATAAGILGEQAAEQAAQKQVADLAGKLLGFASGGGFGGGGGFGAGNLFMGGGSPSGFGRA